MRHGWEAELEAAVRSRQDGNEGRARVCARRAAGMAARLYLLQRGIPSENAYQALLRLAELPDLEPDLLMAAQHLTLRVGEDFKLPVEADLIADARMLCERLTISIR